MRKLITILALLGLSTGFVALTASADTTVTYDVSGTFTELPPSGSTSQSNAGDAFTLTFSVDSGVLGTSPIGNSMSPDVPVTFTYNDITTPGLSLTDQSGIVNFFTTGNGGLFGLSFTGPDGNMLMLELVGLGCFPLPPIPATCVGGFTDGTPPVLTTGGPFAIDDTGFGFFGEFDPSGTPLGANGIMDGTVTATPSTSPVPEPSSLLLLGSGFLAIGGFARKRLVNI
jgi:hypothetical protein